MYWFDGIEERSQDSKWSCLSTKDLGERVKEFLLLNNPLSVKVTLVKIFVTNRLVSISYMKAFRTFKLHAGADLTRHRGHRAPSEAS